MQDSQMRKSHKEHESESGPAIAVDQNVTEPETEELLVEGPEARVEAESGSASAEAGPDESPADEQPDTSEHETEPDVDEASADEELAVPKLESAAPHEIPDDILETARAVMVGFVETRPDAYVAKLEVSPSEWMTITDDSLSVAGVDDLVQRSAD